MKLKIVENSKNNAKGIVDKKTTTTTDILNIYMNILEQQYCNRKRK